MPLRDHFHTDLLRLYGGADPQLADPPPHPYAVTLRTRQPPRRRHRIEAWFHPMAVGQPLPTLPVGLSDSLRIDLPLETAYEETRRVLGIA